MIDTSTTAINVHARWIAPGCFFLWGSRYNGGICDAHDLKSLLFAWHEPSFYGTFIEVAESMNVEGLQLSALEALDYFCSPAAVSHTKLEWSGELRELMSLAPHVKDALVQGRCMPDFAKWKAGELGWKLQLPEPVTENGISELARQWMDRLIPNGARRTACCGRASASWRRRIRCCSAVSCLPICGWTRRTGSYRSAGRRTARRFGRACS
ncbi:hypothetical protein [Paenibacillus konkukensis]|uniref:hypothetical protein n=1 Tax=Paenibacillus konkukensis TaxID=2020716 RepID=UPI00201DF77A|nr:hypothetical protein [Paenibacillus konkukensis]